MTSRPTMHEGGLAAAPWTSWVLGLAAGLAVFFRSLSLPCWDWAENYVYPYFMGRGLSLYVSIVDHHTPAVYWLLYWIGFGESPMPGRLNLVAAVVLGVTAFLIFTVEDRVGRRASAVIATLYFLAWFPFVGGLHVWNELFMAPGSCWRSTCWNAARKQAPWRRLPFVGCPWGSHSS